MLDGGITRRQNVFLGIGPLLTKMGILGWSENALDLILLSNCWYVHSHTVDLQWLDH